MTTTENAGRPIGIKVIILLFLVDAAISVALLVRGTPYRAVNEIGVAVDLIAMVGLWSMTRWGAAFTIVASGKGIGQCILTLQMAYLDLSPAVNSVGSHYGRSSMPWLTIVTDIFIVIYLFKGIFANRFK